MDAMTVWIVNAEIPPMNMSWGLLMVVTTGRIEAIENMNSDTSDGYNITNADPKKANGHMKREHKI